MLMKIKNKFQRIILLSFCVLVSACGNNELNRNKAESLIETKLDKQCSLNKLLEQEPEFSHLRNTKFCHVDVEVSGISRPSETESIAEYSATFINNKSAIKDWLDAYEKMSKQRKQTHDKEKLYKIIKQAESAGNIFPSTSKDNAKFRLYDDGWRLE